MAGAPKGNRNASKLDKLKTLNLEQEAYSSFCKHLEEGGKQETWCFDHPEISVTYETMDKYITENPIDFPAIKKKKAYAKGYRYWEKVAEQHALGQNKCVTPALQMIMRNKFGWDREEKKEVAAPQYLDNQLKILESVDGEWIEVKR